MSSAHESLFGNGLLFMKCLPDIKTSRAESRCRRFRLRFWEWPVKARQKRGWRAKFRGTRFAPCHISGRETGGKRAHLRDVPSGVSIRRRQVLHRDARAAGRGISCAISESVTGFTAEDRAFLHLDYGKGMLDPDRRMVASLGGADHGYERYSGLMIGMFPPMTAIVRGRFQRVGWSIIQSSTIQKVPRLDFRLGLYMPNTLGVVHAATFYRDNGDDALLISVNRLEEWKSAERALWTDYRSIDNLRFYSDGDHKYMATGLAGEKRYWVVGLIPRDQVVMRAIAETPAGPEVWLSTELGIWNLQAQKDRSVDWTEKLDTPVPPDDAATNKTPPADATPLSYDGYVRSTSTNMPRAVFLTSRPFMAI